MKQHGSLPPFAMRILLWILPQRLQESVLGDLEEEMHALHTSRFRIWMQTLEIVIRFSFSGRHISTAESSRVQPENQGDGIMNTFWSDLRFGIRMLIKAPLFTAVAIFTLALGLGATTAIFSIVNALLIKPLPLPNAEKLVSIIGTDQSGRPQFVSFPDFEDMVKSSPSFDGMTAFVPQSVNLTGRAEPQRVRGGFVSDNFFQVIGVLPTIGRSFQPGVDDRDGANPVCIVQHETWQNLFGADPNFLGKTILLNNDPFTVVGILPKGFRFPYDEVEVWMPHHHWPLFQSARKDGSLQNRSEGFVAPIGLLKKRISFDHAQTELRNLFARLSKQYPEAGIRGIRIKTFREAVVGDVQQIVLILLSAVLFVLLIACTNVANLILSRATIRQREMATRVALGARRSRLIAQLFTETALLWGAGGITGLLAGRWGLWALMALAPEDLPGGIVPTFDFTVFAFAFGFTAITAILFGLVPAIRITFPSVIDAMKERGNITAAIGRTRGRTALVVGQVALTLILLVSSVLMLRSLQRLIHTKVGFQSQNLLTMEYRLPRNKYPEPSRVWQTHQQIIERIRQLPGVESAALTGNLPFSGNGSTIAFEIVGRSPEKDPLRARSTSCSADYFKTMRIPLFKGRVFNDNDRAEAPLVVVINQYLAERYWGTADPVGHQIRIVDGDQTMTAEIVGVVGNTKQFGLDDPDMGYIYGAQAQNPGIFNTIVARTTGDPMQMAGAVRSAVWAVDPEQPVWKIRTIETLIQKSLGLPKFITQLMSGYALIALILAAVGIYGMISYSVAQRTNEIGVRMALGAQHSDVLRMVLKYGLIVTTLGLTLGVLGALLLGRFVESLLYRTSPSDPATYLLVALLLATIAMIATYLPARRAARMDPLKSLRYE